MYERYYNFRFRQEKEIEEMFHKFGDIYEIEKTEKEIIEEYKQSFQNRVLSKNKMDYFINEIGEKFKALAKKSFGEFTIVVHDKSFTGFILLECSILENKDLEDLLKLSPVLDDLCILASQSTIQIVAEQNLYDA